VSGVKWRRAFPAHGEKEPFYENSTGRGLSFTHFPKLMGGLNPSRPLSRRVGLRTTNKTLSLAGAASPNAAEDLHGERHFALVYRGDWW